MLVALPISTLAVLWIGGGRAPQMLCLRNLFGTLLLGAVVFFTLVYDPPNALPLIAFHGGQEPEHMALSIDPGRWVDHLYRLLWVFPYGLAFLPVAAFLAVGMVGQSPSKEDCAPIFLFILFILCGTVLVTMANTSGGRFWLFTAPLLALVITDVLGRLVTSRAREGKRRWNMFEGRTTIILLLMGGVVANVGFGSLVQGTSSYFDNLKGGYGWPCQLALDARCSEDIRRSYDILAREVKPEDLVVSSNPWVTHYYLGRVDGLLREKVSREGFSAFQEPSEEYFGIPIIDTLSELGDFLDSDRRTWVIADPKAKAYSSLQTHDFLINRYVNYYSDGLSNIYLSCEDPPCTDKGADSPDINR